MTSDNIDTFFFDVNLKKKFIAFRDKMKLEKKWYQRNIVHGEVIVATLEVDHIFFNQSIFVRDTPELDKKLTKIGFEPLYGFPDEKLYEDFSRIMYNKKFNVALSLYKPEHAYAIRTAYDIVKGSINAKIDPSGALVVFLSAVKQLMGSADTKNKQILLG